MAVVPAGSAPENADTHHVGLREERRLTEHRRLGLDPTDPPAEDAEPVDHRRVGIRTDQGVREGDPVPHAHDLAEMLEVHLVADPGAGRNDAQTVERLLCPPEEGVALTVAPVLPLDVGLVRVSGSEEVDLHGMVDDQVDRDERIDGGGIATRPGDRAPHRREVHHRRHAREVLHQDASRHERDVGRGLRPSSEGSDVLVGDVPGPGAAEEVLEEDRDRVRQPAHVRDARLGEPRERVEVEGPVRGLDPRSGAGEFRGHANGPLVVVPSLRLRPSSQAILPGVGEIPIASPHAARG